MKRLFALVLLLLFLSASFLNAKEWYNNVQYLERIPKTNLGDILKTRPGSGGNLPMVVSLASNNSPTVDIASAVLSAPLYAYSPIAGMAGQYVLGKGLQSAVDLVSAYNEGHLQQVPLFNDVIEDTFGSESQTIVPGDVIATSGGNKSVSGGTITTCLSVQFIENATSFGAGYIIHGTTLYQIGPDAHPNADDDECRFTPSPKFSLTSTTNPPTWPRSIPSLLNLPLAQQLADSLSQKINSELNNFTNALKDLLTKFPQYVPDPPNVTNQDVAYNSNQEIYDNRQETIDYLTNQYNNAVTNNNSELAQYYQDKIQEEQARQEEEQAKEEKEETFSPIADDPFKTPYDPGPFDIPTRFTSFMANVKTSGLFSFSSGFFNSLPADGSPIYTIEAGQYGTHTVDLSETLSAGLAVLKTVFLLLFGFLSIRVVVLKR